MSMMGTQGRAQTQGNTIVGWDTGSRQSKQRMTVVSRACTTEQLKKATRTQELMRTARQVSAIKRARLA